jgi:hypothetical protein
MRVWDDCELMFSVGWFAMKAGQGSHQASPDFLSLNFTTQFMIFTKTLLRAYSLNNLKLIKKMTSTFEIQPIERFIGQSAAIKRPRVCFFPNAFISRAPNSCIRLTILFAALVLLHLPTPWDLRVRSHARIIAPDFWLSEAAPQAFETRNGPIQLYPHMNSSLLHLIRGLQVN